MRWTISATLLGAIALLVPLAAGAADLDEDRRAGSLYEDQHYSDMDADPPPPHPQYGSRYAEPRGYPPSYRDQPYLAPMNPPRYSEAPRYDRECLPRREIRARLNAEGWGGFHDIDIRGPVAYVKVDRPDGQLYHLEVDRCTGRVITARRIGYAERPYAHREPPRYRGY